MALANKPTARQGQWLLLGHRNGEVFAFTSSNGTDFSLQPEPILETSATSLNAAVGMAQGWLLATTPDRESGGTAITLYQSSDGSAWTARDGTAAGLPRPHCTFHPLNMAAGPAAVLLVGQENDPSRPPFSRASSSTDGGNSWQNATPDSSGVGLLGNALWGYLRGDKISQAQTWLIDHQEPNGLFTGHLLRDPLPRLTTVVHSGRVPDTRPHAAALSRRRARTALRKAARMDGPGPQRAKRQSLGGFPPHR
ncbi:hypothetical protein NG697_15065 [Pseudarthrobacter sp. MDT3-26]|uniref:hypothetical protein n=1 Tax=Pseudarthrobacter raffinosi TaxID=2953651 RepID=UPI00208FA838|nr:hypothetical protein [Pseudarthrobacter sp. MDT3-26]MCO4264225.1 hypothetical protein [Pseudarthrobacter sp. MDT3-26]